MGIREEIKRLRGIAHYDENDSYISKVDILSVLDEYLGECVANWDANEELSNVPAGIRESFRPGDHISIYVRRKDESSS